MLVFNIREVTGEGGATKLIYLLARREAAFVCVP